LESISTSDTEVFNTLTNLDPYKSMGADDIGPKVLKHCTLAIYEPLRHLFQWYQLNVNIMPSHLYINLAINHLSQITDLFCYCCVSRIYWYHF